MKKRRDIKDPFQINNVIFFKIPLEFQSHMNSLSQSEKDIYVCFMIQVHYRKTLRIEMPIDTILYWTGIKTPSTANTAIKGLAQKGWVKDIIYQNQKPNIYVLNLKPLVNEELISKINSRSENTSKAKIKSIENGEKGKFEKGHKIRQKKELENENL